MKDRHIPEMSDMTGSPVKRFKAGRVCAYPDCSTILNPYNPRKFCLRHSKRINYYEMNYRDMQGDLRKHRKQETHNMKQEAHATK